MKLKEIARSGIKGRKKDTLLLKIVISLTFMFIITATIYRSSTDKTKIEQRYNLYGEWQAAYLNGDKDTLESIKKEPLVTKVGVNIMLGNSNTIGNVGTFNDELIHMGRFGLYDGRVPESDNEIMIELNQLSQLGGNIKVGDKIKVSITNTVVDRNLTKDIMALNDEFYELGLYPDYMIHKETPYEEIQGLHINMGNTYVYYYPKGSDPTPENIRNNGFLQHQDVTIEKEFVICGIIQSYTDKWDVGGYSLPNSYITEHSGKEIINALHKSNLVDLSEFEFKYNLFLKSESVEEKIYEILKPYYPNKELSKNNTIALEYRTLKLLYMLKTEGTEEHFLKTYGMEKIDTEEFLSKYYGVDNVEELLQGSKTEVVNEENTRYFDNFRLNTISYPNSFGRTENLLNTAILVIIFLATASAIFQIFLTQMKKRTRKIVLLKSIGATNGQIARIIIWEGLYLLGFGLIVGVIGGFGTSALVVTYTNKIMGRVIMYYIKWPSLLLGILVGILSFWVGILIPMIIAMRIPLTGTMTKPPSHKTTSKYKKKKDILSYFKKNYTKISLDYMKQNRGKNSLSLCIHTLIITLLLTTVFLCYLSFGDYRDTVIKKNKPSYALGGVYGETRGKIDKMNSELLQIQGIDRIESYKVGNQLLFWYHSIEDNDLLRQFEKALPNTLVKEHFSKYNTDLSGEEEWIRNAYYTKIYGVEVDSELYFRYMDSITEGNINKERFESGEEVIVMVPLYYPKKMKSNSEQNTTDFVDKNTTEDNRFHWILNYKNIALTSYSNSVKQFYKTQEGVKPGDKIYLSSDAEKIEADMKIMAFHSKEVTVGGVITYFPGEAIWPFSDNVANYTVISSMKGLELIYPNAKYGLLTVSLNQMKDAVNTIAPTKFGRTNWYLYTNNQDEKEVTDASLLAYANKYGLSLYNYRDSTEQLRLKALNISFVIGLLGISSATIAIVILYNTIISKMEQDKNRIGILQAMGITKSQFIISQMSVGAFYSLTGIIIANTGLFIVMFLTSVGTSSEITMTFREYITDIFLNRLWQYPWELHIGLCIGFFVLSTFMNYFPSRSIIKRYPVDNIRSLNR